MKILFVEPFFVTRKYIFFRFQKRARFILWWYIIWCLVRNVSYFFVWTLKIYQQKIKHFFFYFKEISKNDFIIKIYGNTCKIQTSTQLLPLLPLLLPLFMEQYLYLHKHSQTVNILMFIMPKRKKNVTKNGGLL